MSHPLALIIEDNQDQAEILAMALQAAGFETEIIQDGYEALRRLEAIVPDMVVLDMYLPRVSGTGILLQNALISLTGLGPCAGSSGLPGWLELGIPGREDLLGSSLELVVRGDN